MLPDFKVWNRKPKTFKTLNIMTLIYVILDSNDRIPILTASSIEKAELLLNQYMGVEGPIVDESVEYIGFEPFDDRGYYTIYEGEYKYKTEDGEQRFIRYCMGLDSLD
jgi:hypothetical protein